jgi:MFS family permease
MEVMFAIPLILVPFFWPVITGLMAKNFGRKFWPWFLIGIPLPFIAVAVLLFLPTKTNKKAELRAFENDEIVDHRFSDNKEHKMNNEQSHLSASA